MIFWKSFINELQSDMIQDVDFAFYEGLKYKNANEMMSNQAKRKLLLMFNLYIIIIYS